jgi:hypothetical protein
MPHRGGSHWEELLSLALRIMDESGAGAALVNSWTLGGGTALMLWAGHRESHDIDIFLDDPQLLAYLDPRLHETALPAPPDGYEGDGARFLTIVFSGLGEIDFICAAPLTAEHAQSRIIGGREIPLERPQEIIAKKIVYRGAQMQPRDMFDIAAALRHSGRDELAQALAPYQDACARSPCGAADVAGFRHHDHARPHGAPGGGFPGGDGAGGNDSLP